MCALMSPAGVRPISYLELGLYQLASVQSAAWGGEVGSGQQSAARGGEVGFRQQSAARLGEMGQYVSI